MVQLVIAHVDVIAAVIANGETEPFAAAAQACINQLFILQSLQLTVLEDLKNTNLRQRFGGQFQGRFIGFVGQFENFRQGRLGHRLIGGELVQQVSDRKLHGEGVRIRPS